MAADLKLPPGFRFHPTDEELVMHYLCKKCSSQPIDVPIVAEIDLYKYHPWDLPDMALYGEKEWYFFSPRDRKYPNGSRPNRSAGCGYWKATGADKPIGGGRGSKPIAIKKALVFYAGKAPKGDKTNWIMHEYRLANVDRSARNNNNSLRLDDWILCRIYNKKGTKEKRHVSSNQEIKNNIVVEDEKKPEILTQLPPPVVKSDMMYPDVSDSIPRMFTESSTSDHVVSPGFTSEVQSNTRFSEWDKNALVYPFNYNYDTTFMNMDMDVNGMVINHSSPQNNYHRTSMLQDIFLDFQRPF